MALERPNSFDFWGPQTLVGPELKIGDTAPAFTLIKAGNKEVTSTEFAGKPIVISVVPSLDTGICSRQTKRFNDESGKLGDSITFLTVSADLPFTQARWCGAEGVENVQVLSDHRDLSFGDAYGTHIKELRFESRAVFVVDAEGIVRHVEYLPTAGQEPNYDAVLAALQAITGSA